MKRVAVLALTLTACTQPGAVFFALPDTGDAASVVLGVERSNANGDGFELERVVALPAEGGDTALHIGLMPGRELRVSALLYDESLSALRLSPGLVRAADPMQPSRSLAVPARVLQLRLTEAAEVSSPWSDAPGLLSNLSRFRVRALVEDDRCAEFSQRTLRLNSAASALFVLPADDESAVVGTAESGVFRVPLDGEPRSVGRLPDAQRVRAPGNADDTHVWLAGYEGRIFRTPSPGIVVGELELVSQSPHRRLLFRLSGTPPSNTDDIEVFALAVSGQIERFDGLEWTDVARTSTGSSTGGILRVGPRHVVAVNGTTEITRWRDGVTTRERLSDAQGGPSAIAMVPGIGPVVGTRLGEFYAHDGEDWRQLVADLPFRVELLEPSARGFIYGGQDGSFGQYVHGVGLCQSLSIGAGSGRFAAQLGPDLIIAGTTRDKVLLVSVLLARRR